MPSLRDVASMATALPEVREGASYGHRAWFVGKTHFAWERPFSKADLGRFEGRPVPSGAILAVRVDDLGEKQAVLASNDAFFDIPHLDGRPIVLVRLEAVSVADLRDALEDAWLSCAPPALAQAYRGR